MARGSGPSLCGKEAPRPRPEGKGGVWNTLRDPRVLAVRVGANRLKNRFLCVSEADIRRAVSERDRKGQFDGDA